MVGLPEYTDAKRTPFRGRRERSMQDKQLRIFAAAAALFAERGFDSVGTQEIAERADVAVGTVFRYASSKAELLLMVYNGELRDAINTGVRAAAVAADPVESVNALVQAVLESSACNPATVVAYQRELLFGSATDEHRTAGLALVGELEDAIASRLATAARSAGVDGEPVLREGQRAARTVFAALSLLLAGPSTGAHPGADPVEELRGQVTQIVRGFLATLPSTIETY
ncbi:TetR/AcrR family transcriptional regulator [Cryobacterium sp. MDB2-10]|uniref:TetR/AcrR family transcriptional regulator n=1 Tax=Cryobacterium sp. MDB2-10 TaxID=1259177 RepID=UPI00107460B8|nr:TetR/AcrR family transcriptional regulator [Cryobacterium sp. MDB2-10]TFC16409.1 TetR/AcrR family transcriptional regulator [Cryobacterium sp. MDB2-10]